MKKLLLLTFVLTVLTQPVIAKAGSPGIGDDFEAWLVLETDIAKTQMQANIEPPGTVSGFVVASPSQTNPNYFYHWVRDAAITMEVVVRLYESGLAGPTQITSGRNYQILDHYIQFSRNNQTSNAPASMGEPKFNTDGSPFIGPWGRPQNDSPSLRALTMLHLAQIWMKNGRKDLVVPRLYDAQLPSQSVIKTDLEYISHHWSEPSFDIWEEIQGEHFYTLMVIRKALIEGANLAQTLGDQTAANWYRSQASLIEPVINQHWDDKYQIMRATRNQVAGLSLDTKWTGLDTAVILATLHTNPPWSRSDFCSPLDDRILSTAQKLKESFRTLYPVNSNGTAGVGIGRYPEDAYYGGNPWFLTTQAFAELYYQVATMLSRQGNIQITPRNAPFFQDVLGKSVQLPMAYTTISIKDPVFNLLIARLAESADDYLRRVRTHLPANGSISEQFRRDNGFMDSAHDLTWSYGSFITAVGERRKKK